LTDYASVCIFILFSKASGFGPRASGGFSKGRDLKSS